MKSVEGQALDQNSKRTRVEPVFRWLRAHGESAWPQQFLSLASGPKVTIKTGKLTELHFESEVAVPPSTKRLAWMIRNAERLAPLDGRRWAEYRTRVTEHPYRDKALADLDDDVRQGVPAQLILEGPSHADCLIECEDAFLWIEGKRNDWLASGTTWDVARDQLARNLEALWSLASAKNKEYTLIICHEGRLKHHEELLIDGYRTGAWIGGWPHLEPATRNEFGARIATLTWSEIASHWPLMRSAHELSDLA